MKTFQHIYIRVTRNEETAEEEVEKNKRDKILRNEKESVRNKF